MNTKQPNKNLQVPARWIILLILAAGFFANAQSTNDSTETSFRTFEVIPERNIFDPNRYPRHSNYHPRTTYRGLPTFSLAGIMSYRKGMFAFFNGTSDEYQKALQEGGAIAGYTVKKMTFNGVQLERDGKTTLMNVGEAMQRQGDNWVLVKRGEWVDESSTTTTDSGSQNSSSSQNTPSEPAVAPPATDGGAGNDIIKRLMQQRAQELK
jgi:hypothetical protein